MVPICWNFWIRPSSSHQRPIRTPAPAVRERCESGLLGLQKKRLLRLFNYRFSMRKGSRWRTRFTTRSVHLASTAWSRCPREICARARTPTFTANLATAASLELLDTEVWYCFCLPLNFSPTPFGFFYSPLLYKKYLSINLQKNGCSWICEYYWSNIEADFESQICACWGCLEKRY